MKYFFDNCISYRYAEMLAALGVDAEALRHELPEDIKDVPLFKELGGRDLVFVSDNRTQLTRVAEARELKKAGITSLYLEPFWNKLGFWAQAAWLIKHWPAIDAYASVIERGTCASIKQRGRIHIIQV